MHREKVKDMMDIKSRYNSNEAKNKAFSDFQLPGVHFSSIQCENKKSKPNPIQRLVFISANYACLVL